MRFLSAPPWGAARLKRTRKWNGGQGALEEISSAGAFFCCRAFLLSLSFFKVKVFPKIPIETQARRKGTPDRW